jgi:hypothetical protein
MSRCRSGGTGHRARGGEIVVGDSGSGIGARTKDEESRKTWLVLPVSTCLAAVVGDPGASEVVCEGLACRGGSRVGVGEHGQRVASVPRAKTANRANVHRAVTRRRLLSKVGFRGQFSWQVWLAIAGRETTKEESLADNGSRWPVVEVAKCKEPCMIH